MPGIACRPLTIHNAIFESLMDRLEIKNSEVENFYKSNYPHEFKRPGTIIFVSGLVFGWYPWIQKGLIPVFRLVLGDLNYFARGSEILTESSSKR